MKKTQHFIVLIIFLMVCSGCATYIGYEGLYEGRVIDIDTNQPIEGAVVHGTRVDQTGGSNSIYDSKEVLTDKDGNFKIDGVGMLVFSQITEMEIYVFKDGYSRLSNVYWSRLNKYSSPTANAELREDKAVIKLRWMSRVSKKD